MKPGGDLDSIVAAKVMGWEWKDWTKKNAEEVQNPYLFKMELCPPSEPWKAGGYIVPKFSTKIHAAWTILEKLKQDYYFDIRSSDGERDVWNCIFQKKGKITQPWQKSVGDSAAHAICLAALRISGHGVFDIRGVMVGLRW